MFEFQSGQAYLVTYECRDIGYGIEQGVEEYVVYGGVEPMGKHGFTLADGTCIYLFDDEILEVEAEAPKPELITVVRVEFRMDGDFSDRASNKMLNAWLAAGEDDPALLSYEIVSRGAYVTTKK